MIHIEKDQIVPENENLRVFSVSGDYSDNDLIECYDIENPNSAACAFSAAFVKYGGIIYRFGMPEEVGEALLKIDPKSTHDYAVLFKEEEERRKKRLGGDFTPENPIPADENISQVAQDEAKIDEGQVVITPPENSADTTIIDSSQTSLDQSISSVSSTSTSNVSTTTPSNISTTTETILQSEEATSTQFVIPPEATSTPDANATSTQALKRVKKIEIKHV